LVHKYNITVSVVAPANTSAVLWTKHLCRFDHLQENT